MKVLHKIEIGRDAGHPAGLAFFTPRIASSPIVNDATPLQNTVAQVPPSLLDALTPDARQSMPRTGELLSFSPVRRGLKPAELYRAEEVLTPLAAVHFHIKATITPLLLTASMLRAYTMTLPGDMDDGEKAFVIANLAKAEAWIPQKNGPVAVIKLGPLVRASDTNGAVLLDQTSGVGSLSNALDNRPATEQSPHGVPIDLVVTKIDVLTKVGGKLPNAFFNLMEWTMAANQPPPDVGPLLAAANVFDLGFSETFEEFTERVQAIYFPSLLRPTVYNEKFRGKYLDFNKLRLFLRAEGGPTQSTVFLTWPDAILPLPAPPAVPVQPEPPPSQIGLPTSNDNPRPSWWVGHSFSKQLEEKPSASATRTTRNDESLRYMFHRDPGRRWMLGGLLEHQYSHRIPIAQDGSAVHLKLRASNEVLHPAAVTRKAKPTGSGPDERPIPVLRHTLDRSGKLITLEFPTAHLTAVVASNTSEELKRDATRDLYEALSDLRIALTAPETLLEIELWDFDNLHSIVRNSAVEDDTRFPGYVTHATRIAQGTLHLATHAAALTAGIEMLLVTDWDGFTAKLATFATSGAMNWFSHPIDIDNTWTWIDMKGSPLATAPDIDSTANLVRLGLLLRRPQDTTIASPANIADLMPTLPSAELMSQSAILRLPDPTAPGKFVPEQFGSARGDAWKSVQDWTKLGSGLSERYAWLETILPKRTDDPQGVREKKLAAMLGELRPYLDKPEGTTNNVPTVVDLYYIPHAFAPIDGHPDFNDASVTNGFAVWLLSLVGDLVNGREADRIDLLPPTPQTAEEPFLVQNRLSIVLAKTARALADLVLPVNAPSPPDGSSQPDIDLFNAVTKLKAELDDSALTQGDPLKEAITALIVRRPELYATTRGIGVVIARPETWSRALYAVRIDKRVRDKTIDDQHPDRIVSQWSFLDLRGAKDLKPTDPNTLARLYWLDPLEEPYYDAEFSVEQTQFRTGLGAAQHTIRVDLDPTRLIEKRVLDGATTVIGKRGGTQARSGEDALEGTGLFTGEIQVEAPTGGQVDPVRNLEANTVHWNAAWRVTDAATNQVTDWNYPLPSRSFPVRPIPVRAQGSNSLNAPLTLAVMSIDPKQKYVEGFVRSIGKVLADRQTVEVESGKDGTAATKWLLLPKSQALADPGHIKGWHQIDTFLAFHHLMVDLETENNQSALTSEDIIEIDVETSANGFSDQNADSGDARFKSVLAQFYHYYTTPAGSGVTPPAPISQTEFAGRAERWLLNLADTTGNPFKDENEGGQALLRPAKPPAANPLKERTTTYRYHRSEHPTDPWKLVYVTETNPSPHTDGVGNAMACELFTSNVAKSTLLRISVLVEPWSICRVRARIVRNAVDYQGGEADAINKAFLLRSPSSDWSSHGRDSLILTSDLLQDLGLSEDEAVLDVLPQITLHDWQYGPAATAILRLGAMVKHTLSATIDTDYFGPLPWWSSLTMSNTYSVSGVVQTPGSDHYIRIGVGVGEMKPMEERKDSIPRQIVVPAPADTLEQALGTIAYSDIGSSALELRLLWTSQQGDRALDITWPIAFQEG